MEQPQSFEFYPFQQRVFKYLMNGRSVILQAPTGSGKTRAGLMPFQWNLSRQGIALPLTCRYAVPMRVLANQFFAEYASLAEKIDRLAPTKLVDRFRPLDASAVAIQTGEQPDDPQFESLLTFCTIDQLLASFLAVPYGLGPNRANLNVAGVAGSYLILDEFHLYPLLGEGENVFGARTTTLAMLRLLKTTHTPFVLMTATFSSTLLEQLGELLDAEVVRVDAQEYQEKIAKERMRTFWRAEEPMDAAQILAEHRQRAQNKATLIVCNTVARAQRLYLQLRQAQADGTRVILVHSRFSKDDRQRLSKEVEQALGETMWRNGAYCGPDMIVIATQVVEVGLNISAHTLHTEIAPANSVIQRAGRCARFPRQQGQVIVYPLPERDDGQAALTLPYRKDLCEATWRELKVLHGRQVGFFEEQQIIDAVHMAEDLDLLQRFKQYENQILQLIFKNYTSNDRGVTSQLIRDVSQVHILIHSEPDAITETPWRWESFSMHPGSLASERRWNALQERREQYRELDWVCKKAEPKQVEQLEPDGADGIDNRQKTVYEWTEVSREVAAQSLIIALPPQLARYDGELGFVLLDGEFDDLGLGPNGYESKPLSIPDHSSEQWSKQQSYQEHISGLLHAYKSGLCKDMAYMAGCLEREFGLPAGIIDQAVRLAIACHDLGKLDRTWQQWARNWQMLIAEREQITSYQLPEAAFCFAKTDNRSEYKQWQRDVTPKRPHHACESVMLGRRLIADSLGISKQEGRERLPLLRAVCGAIARHHTAQASEYAPARLDEQAKAAALEVLCMAHAGSSWSYDPDLLTLSIAQGGDLQPETASSSYLTKPTYEDGEAGLLETWLYFLLVRTLRLADQRAGS